MNLFDLPLFQGMNETEQEQIAASGCIHQKQYQKSQVIFHIGDQIREFGIVLFGSIQIENIDLWGNRSILSSISPGQIFAETYALCNEPMMVSAIAAETSSVVFFRTDILNMSFLPEELWKQKIMRNLLFLSARKNLTLSRRIFCTTPKNIRERILVYLSEQAAKTGSYSLQIPFDRQGLADYLNVDRSALSKELGKMRKEGILDFYKNQFILRNTI